MKTAPVVVVAMSGGVDSSVTAALLKQQGYRVIGMMLRLWSEPGMQDSNRCCTPDAMAQARRVAAILEIPFYAVDAQEIFREVVVEFFIDGYAKGETPNPCILCNKQIRWSYLYDRARAMGADYMATGHYARLEESHSGRYRLMKAVDTKKDQSYVLHILGQEQLAHALFPLGVYTKPEVRGLANKFGLPVAERADSQDLCFVGGGDYRHFLQRIAPQTEQPGPILTRTGMQVGEHKGLAFYTIGQRKGLGIASPSPLYVVAKDLRQNAVIVGEANELGKSELVAGPVHWVSGEPPERAIRAQVKIRYKAQESPALVTPLEDGKAHVRFDEPQRDITPGQAAVFFADEECLGGGFILQDTEPGT